MISGSMNEFGSSSSSSVPRRCASRHDRIFRADERDKVDDIAWATLAEGCEEYASIDGVEGKGGHVFSESGDATLPVKRLKPVKLE
jgi:hypothetical protein